MNIRSPYLDMTEAAEFLRCKDRKTGGPSPIAALRWLDRRGVKTKKRGHVVLVHRDDLEAALEPRKVAS